MKDAWQRRPMPDAHLAELFVAAREAAASDNAASRKEYLFALPGWASDTVLSSLRDPRDEPVAALYFNVLLIALPAAALLYTAPACHALGACYLVCLYRLFLTRFLVALLHVTEHRPLFRKGRPSLSFCQKHASAGSTAAHL